MYETIIAAIFANAIALAVLGFLLKSLLGQFLAKDMAAFQAKLEEKSNSTLEAYRADLEKERIKLQIAYGGIFEKQANTILELFKLLSKLERQMQLAVHAESEGREYSKFIEVWKTLIETYEENKILLTSEIEEGFDNIVRSIFSSVQDYKLADDRILNFGHRLSEKQFDNLFERQDKALEVMQKIPALKQDLITKLRQIIGIHFSSSATNGRP